MAKLFIGMPVFNGEKYVEQAIDSLLKQSYQDWQLLISDNCSTDKTLEICQRKAQDDQRISVFCQSDNIGAMNNFKFLVEQSSGEYFMWAAADDLWHENFVEKLITGLEENSDCSMAFCNPVIINVNGTVIERYPSFRKFGLDNQFDSVINFLRDPEVYGKANIVYSIYRTNFIKSIYSKHAMKEAWGSDMVFAFSCMCRSKIFINEDVLFYKRDRNYIDGDKMPPKIISIVCPDNYIFPLKQADQYINGLIFSAQNTVYEKITKTIMFLRKDLLKKNMIIRFRRAKEIIYNFLVLLSKLFNFSRYVEFIKKLHENKQELNIKNIFLKIKELIHSL